jgi:histidinol-phosphate aminotransferase
MKSFDLSTIVRPHLKGIVPYSSARDDFKGEAQIFLDANENPFNTGFNRYPDPHQIEVKRLISQIKNVPIDNIFVGNGSDEAIDLLYRAFCEPGVDNVITLPPTYGMYKVSASINNILVKEVLLDEFFDISTERVLAVVNPNTKLIWLCSPNNPTGNSLSVQAIKALLEKFNGLVVVDEAYIDFSERPSLVSLIPEFSNLVVLQTLSKAWGLASLRVGLCIASVDVSRVLSLIKPPYNISGPNQQQAIQALTDQAKMQERVKQIKEQRQWLIAELNKNVKLIFTIYPSDSNFLLVKVKDANLVYRYLSDRGIIVRNRSKEPNCENCLRITVGTAEENQTLVKTLKEYAQKNIVY